MWNVDEECSKNFKNSMFPLFDFALNYTKIGLVCAYQNWYAVKEGGGALDYVGFVYVTAWIFGVGSTIYARACPSIRICRDCSVKCVSQVHPRDVVQQEDICWRVLRVPRQV